MLTVSLREGIDWRLWRLQKRLLLELLDQGGPEELQGVVNTMDEIGDRAADQGCPAYDEEVGEASDEEEALASLRRWLFTPQEAAMAKRKRSEASEGEKRGGLPIDSNTTLSSILGRLLVGDDPPGLMVHLRGGHVESFSSWSHGADVLVDFRKDGTPRIIVPFHAIESITPDEE